MKPRTSNVLQALLAMWWQFLLVADQFLNVVGCGLLAVLMAAITGKPQNVAFSDETLSAHAWRAHQRRRIWGLLLMPLIDFLFIWQRQDAEVNQAAGDEVAGHCERAFWKEKLRRGLPPEYREVA